MPTLEPLSLPQTEWRSRWLVAPEWDMLHRISTIVWDDEYKIAGDGQAVCGLAANFLMPGILSRMGLRRCPACCVALRIPEGDGAPFNQKDLWWEDR